ncbi:MAG: DUF374 domain-containing protein [Chlorobiaceae bacterium]|nr:DUF374 domain-containing protein [Chlorobiaceae bacterium]
MRVPAAITRHLLPLALEMLYRTLRLKIVFGAEQGRIADGPVLFAFWHGKMVTGWLLARKLFAGRMTRAVVSLSGDGAILSDTLGSLGFSLIRGSSSNAGSRVREEIADTLKKQEVIAITPDGPRGPLHRFKYGSIRLASRHRTPLLFADIRYESAWRLKSWDRFEIPKPFSRVEVSLHRIEVPEFTSEAELQVWCGRTAEMFAHE